MTNAPAQQDHNGEAVAVHGFEARSLWYFLMQEIAAELAAFPESQDCTHCSTPTYQLLSIRAGTAAHSCEIPVPVCGSCSREIPFVTVGRSHRPWAIVSLLTFALISAAAGVWPLVTLLLGLIVVIPIFVPTSRRMTIAERNSRLEGLLRKTPLLNYLQMNVPGFHLELPLKLRSYISINVDHVEVFRASLREYRQLKVLVSNYDLQRSEIDSRLFNMLITRTRSLAATVLNRADVSEAIALRVDCAILPGRRLEFAVFGDPDDSHPLRQQLVVDLRQTPPIGVRWPVIFSFQFANPAGCDTANVEKLNTSLFGWPRIDDEQTIAEAACRFFGVTPDPSAPLLTTADCCSWGAVAPLADSLVADFSDLLLLEGRQEEAIAVLEEAIARTSGSELLLHKLAWLLGHVNQLERGAAVCQQLMDRFPEYSAGWGMLASLQLQMKRPEDAEHTLHAAPKNRRSADFWITSAEVAAALEKTDLAITFLNVAILKNLACVPAYMKQAELFADTGRFDRALHNMEIVERLQPPAPEQISLKSRILLDLNRIQDAIDTLTQGLDVFPGEPFLQFLRADLLLATGKPAMALEDCQAILRRAPDFSAAHELEALIHLETDDPESAVAAAELAMQSDKASPRAWYARGIARLEMQQVELSVDDLEVACRMAPHEMRQRYALARARLAGGETEGALSELDTLLGSHPHSSDALVFRGFLHIALGNSDLAGRDFQQASDLSPRLVSALYGLAVVKRMAGEIPAALQLLDAALQIDPTDEGCLLDRARLLATKDDLNAATRDLDTVLENAPDFLPALLSRARIRLHLGKLDDARRDFDEILKQEPESTEALIGRSVLSEQSGDTESAENDLQKATEHSPEDSDKIEIARLLIRAEIAHHNEQFEDAVGICSQALEIDPENYDARRERARAWWYSDCFVEALDDYQFLIDRAEHPSAELLCCRGGIYNELGEFELALQDLESSRQIAILESISILPWILSSLGRTFTALERWADAEAAFSECLRLGHNSPWFHYYRGLLFIARQDLSNAAKCFRQALSTPRKLPPSKRARAEAFLNKNGQ
ncbi:MAG: tetratricopeptide repeat protein [Planctomyces sp.]